MQIGIIGLPNVGKSTFFNALTKAHAAVADYPFTTIEPNVGIVTVPDARLVKLGDLYRPQKLTPTSIRFVDIAGLVKGASKGEGLGNKFLSHIREMDALVQVIGFFREDCDPVSEIEIIRTELLLADLDVINRRISSVSPRAKCGIKEAKEELDKLYTVKAEIEKGSSASSAPEELNLLTSIPVIYAANVSDIGNKIPETAYRMIPVNAKLECEITELSEEEKKELQVESNIGGIIEAGYKILNFITFYTTVGTEIRAWKIKKGKNIQQAAGQVHTDFEKNFIKAEVFNFAEIEKLGSEKILHENGLVRIEGKDYIVKDGDIIRIKI